MAGLAVAYELRGFGHEVTVLEARTDRVDACSPCASYSPTASTPKAAPSRCSTRTHACRSTSRCANCPGPDPFSSAHGDHARDGKARAGKAR